MTSYEQFCKESAEEIDKQGADPRVNQLTKDWIDAASRHKYCYHFEALGRPIIQYPQDIIALQEIIWKVKPDLIIETGIAHGGSLIWNAAMLSLVDQCEAIAEKKAFDVNCPKRRVIGIDIDIRDHNKAAINNHPMSNRIEMFEGSSIDPTVFEAVKSQVSSSDKVLVCLDSNHTADHVQQELELYASLVSVGSYCIVFDTIIETMSDQFFHDRPWSIGNNPMTAVQQFIKTNHNFDIDKTIEDKLLVTVAPNGFLYRHQ